MVLYANLHCKYKMNAKGCTKDVKCSNKSTFFCISAVVLLFVSLLLSSRSTQLKLVTVRLSKREHNLCKSLWCPKQNKIILEYEWFSLESETIKDDHDVLLLFLPSGRWRKFCVYSLAWASFVHMKSDSPMTDLKQQCSFWCACLFLHSSLQPQKYQPHL